MKKLNTSDFLFGAFWTGWRRWAAWLICLGAILLLGALRKATDAELAFASLAMLPVLAIAWIGGKRNGLFLALLAAAMWGISDIASERQFSAAWVPWANAITRLMTYSLVVILVAEIRSQLERVYELATQDSLTGLLNRMAFLDAGASEVARSRRYGHPMAVIFLDLDNFKQLNDTKGHDAGDAALRATGAAMLGALRSSDRIARLGGDEFAILLPEVEHDAAVEAGCKISAAVSRSLQDFPPVTASIGVAWFGASDRSFPEMLKAADELMYEVKENGKGDMRSRRYAAVNEPGS